MRQIFRLQLSTDTLEQDAQQLGVTSAQLQHIQVTVMVSKVEQNANSLLCFTYHIQFPNSLLAAKLDWEAWSPSKVSFTDYLWEQTCLECFIANNQVDYTRYIEVNASSNGGYALYCFEDYRHPSLLPPPPLLLADKASKAKITWQHNTKDPDAPAPYLSALFFRDRLKPVTRDLTAHLFLPSYQYQRSFSVDISAIRTIQPNTKIQIHPCVILRFGDTFLYYAQTHYSPPDFHQRSRWSYFLL